MAESRLMQSMLLDFYGELLTEKQRECFDLHINEDLSLSEIAEQSGISRQGVWDNIRRAEAALQEMEEKTGLIRRFSETRAALEQIADKAAQLIELSDGKAAELAREIAQTANELKDKG
ncbi:MAG: YlxM family DNA-binding protein [Oscillospiraceae bacterium]|nr:YlxM family DNA-binding protein [Oscillospiraceae bacterium]